MRYFLFKTFLLTFFGATALIGLSLPAHAQNTEVRSWSEIQKELEIIASNPEIQKVLKHPEVRKVLNEYQATVDNLKAQAKAQAEAKVEAKKDEAQTLAQERWDMTVGKLIRDYQASDIPRKLEQGDWSALEETKALLRALPLPEDLTQEKEPYSPPKNSLAE